jgi:hypothetical protein
VIAAISPCDPKGADKCPKRPPRVSPDPGSLGSFGAVPAGASRCLFLTALSPSQRSARRGSQCGDSAILVMLGYRWSAYRRIVKF